jgi:predicted nucleotidyltransferase
MTQQPLYGSHNPRPLSTMRTELVWEGKYDEDGQRREVDIAGCAMPMQQIYQRLNITPKELTDFCEKWHIAELALFGSVLRNDFRSTGENPSDVDLLFSYLPSTNMSLLRRATMKVEFEELIGRAVDLMMASEVIESRNPIRRKEILDSAQIIYVKE